MSLHHGYADLSQVRLHYVQAGEGPLVVLLHGFPDFWYGWRHQIPALARAGFRVVAPDLRGYHLSSRPEGVQAYALRRLAADVAELIAERGEARADVAGHDWGAMVAWGVAALHPDSVRRLAILNVPHPRRMYHGLRTWRQLRRSWYTVVFQLPRLPERRLAAGGFRDLRRTIELAAPPGALEPGDVERYVEAWRRPGVLTAMLNYYRAARRALGGRLPPITAPTLVIWGERDRYLGAELAEPHRRDVPGLRDVVRLPDSSHWVMRDEPERISELLAEFFAGDPPLPGGS
ncbi:MAG: alpha/beta fold hydrolase [Solirubrobacteraceae bacterium]